MQLINAVWHRLEDDDNWFGKGSDSGILKAKGILELGFEKAFERDPPASNEQAFSMTDYSGSWGTKGDGYSMGSRTETGEVSKYDTNKQTQVVDNILKVTWRYIFWWVEWSMGRWSWWTVSVVWEEAWWLLWVVQLGEWGQWCVLGLEVLLVVLLCVSLNRFWFDWV